VRALFCFLQFVLRGMLVGEGCAGYIPHEVSLAVGPE
jgi:hypothetical protein